jgi:integrative and conjugative element protein (TIGR02256 family)
VVLSLWERLNQGIVFKKSPYSCIVFSSKVLRKLQVLVDRKTDDCESGGLLLGFVRGNHFDVRMITVPYKKDHTSRYSFIRRDERHLNIFQAIRLRINRSLTYIGEWHTHPEDNPRPSNIDINEWKSIKSTRPYPVVFMILGKKDFYITVK